MAKFKVGDRVRVVGIDGDSGLWYESYVGKEGVVEEGDTDPYVRFDNGALWWLSFKNIELVDTSNSITTVDAELTHITIGGKRFRLVPED